MNLRYLRKVQKRPMARHKRIKILYSVAEREFALKVVLNPTGPMPFLPRPVIQFLSELTLVWYRKLALTGRPYLLCCPG
jgi:hypothetical protein